MNTKKFVRKIPDRPAADIAENTEVADWLGQTRGRMDCGQREFYENIGVKQQTGDNYESRKTPVPAWVAVRAVRKYGEAEDLHWWINLTVESPPAPGMVAEAAATLSKEQLDQWATGAVGYEALSPERARRLHEFIENSVILFARGLTDAENHLLNQVRVINGLAANAGTDAKPIPKAKPRNARRARRDAKKDSNKQ